MQTEIEAKWLHVDHELMRNKLREIGAACEQKERLMIRQIFDYPDKKLQKKSGWVRVRSEGNKVTLSYKQLNNRSLHGTKEIAVDVSDFKATVDFLKELGLEPKSLQETKRESWKLGNVEIELDTWPWIDPFMEIEAANEELLNEVAQKLGLSRSDALHGSVETAYQAQYDVSEKDVNSWPEIKFGPVPNFLQARRK